MYCIFKGILQFNIQFYWFQFKTAVSMHITKRKIICLREGITPNSCKALSVGGFSYSCITILGIHKLYILLTTSIFVTPIAERISSRVSPIAAKATSAKGDKTEKGDITQLFSSLTFSSLNTS